MKGPTARKCAQRRVAHFSNRRGISPCPGHHWCTIFLWHVTSSINGPHNEGGRIGQKCVRKIRRVQKAKRYPTKNDSGEPEYRSRRLPHAKRSLYQWASPPNPVMNMDLVFGDIVVGSRVRNKVKKHVVSCKCVSPLKGLEPLTTRLKVARSADWAIAAHYIDQVFDSLMTVFPPALKGQKKQFL